jgi:hypothetical protein
MFSRSDLTMLMDATPSPGVSPYLPIHVRGAETRQDPICLKNLIAEARQNLASTGLKPAEVDAILDPAAAMVGDNDFWQHQDIGLALFLGGGQTHSYKVPIAFEPKVAVGPAFHLTPLLPAPCRRRGVSCFDHHRAEREAVRGVTVFHGRG